MFFDDPIGFLWILVFTAMASLKKQALNKANIPHTSERFYLRASLSK
jgi:hypothetical protein